MHRTWILHKTRGLLAALHQPAELTGRDSQRLLETLTSSFRSHLAQNRHGGHDPTSPAASHLTPPLLPSATTPTSSLPATAPRSSSPVPDQHLRSILDNPLFRRAPCPRPTPIAPLTTAQPQQPPQPAQSRPHQTDVFERAVARGLMTVQRAHGFLVHNMLQCPLNSHGRDLRGTRAGFLVLQWLQASGQERNLSFVSIHPSLTALLVSFIIADGLDHVVWTWVDRLLRGDGPTEVHLGSRAVPSAAYLVGSIASNHSCEPELDALHQVLLRAEALYRRASAPYQQLAGHWRALAWHATAESWRHAAPSATLFEEIVALRARLGLDDKTVAMSEAHLDLYHPALPSPTRALAFFRLPSSWDKKLAARMAPQSTTIGRLTEAEDIFPLTIIPSFVERLKCLGLDTVRVLTDMGRHHEAQDFFEGLCSLLNIGASAAHVEGAK